MVSPDLDRMLALAEAAAAEAGKALVRHQAAWGEVEGVHGREVKVRADREAEALIIAALKQGPDLPILSEECGWIGARDNEWTWAVDPLDGSANYARDFPHWAVSIALAHRGRPVVGVVDCCVLGERFTGLVGKGAWLNGRPIQVSDIAVAAEGVLMTGLPARAATDPETMGKFATLMTSFRKVRMIGSAAAALAAVAAGRAEYYRETGGMFWDVAGGCALVEAAGGVVTIVGDALDQPLDVIATNSALVL